MASIFILGSQGFIGSHLSRYFVNNGHHVTGCDVLEASPQIYVYHKLSILSSDFEELFVDNRFDVCINASGSGNVGYSVLHPQSDFDLNVNAVAKALDAIRKHQPSCRFLHISSAAVYGNPLVLPVTETALCSPLSPYGYHKMISEKLCEEYAHVFGLSIAVIRPFSVFGIGLKKQLLWDICCKSDVAQQVQLFGTGEETRDFIHISDFVKAVDLIIEKAAFKLDIFNIATGVSTSIQVVASIFEKYMPGKKIAFSGEIKKSDPSRWLADISKLKELGFSYAADMDTAINEYIEWYKKTSGTV